MSSLHPHFHLIHLTETDYDILADIAAKGLRSGSAIPAPATGLIMAGAGYQPWPTSVVADISIPKVTTSIEDR